MASHKPRTPALVKAPSVPRPGPALPRGSVDERFAVALGGTGATALLARYLEQHGRWETHTARIKTSADGVADGGAITVETRVLVWCACPICADARAYLKLEE